MPLSPPRAALELAGRALLASLFLIAAVQKLQHADDVAAWMASMGVAGGLLPLVIGLELLGGIAVAVGYRTRVAATALGLFSIAAAALFHRDLGNETEFLMFMKNLVIAGGFFVLAAHGPGRLSVDALRARLTRTPGSPS